MLLVGDAGVRLRPVADRFAAEADSEISGKLPGIAKKAAGFFAVAFAAVKIGGFLKDAVGEAVDLGENVSKVGVVFGDAAGQINEFADTASTALGQSRNQALEAAGSFGTLFRGMGIGEQKAADLSTSLVTAASDMASFGNATPQEALDALRSGLVGETEPLRRFGVMLNAAAIEQEAVRLGLSAAGEELTSAAKAQATYSLIMAQTALQTGDFGRTSAGLANQQRILGAQFTDISTDVGGLFVPALANAAGIVTGTVMPSILQITRKLPELGDAFGAVGDVFGVGFSDGAAAVNDATASYSGLAADLLQVAGTAGDLGAVFSETFVDGTAGAELLASDSLPGLAARLGQAGFMAANMGGLLGEAFADGRVGADLLASQSLNGVIARAGVAGFALKESLGGVWGDIIAAAQPVIDALMTALGGLFDSPGGEEGSNPFLRIIQGIGIAAGGLISTLAPILEQIGPLISGYIGRWLPVIEALIPIVAGVLGQLGPIIGDLFAQIGPVLSALMPIVAQVAGVFASTLLTVITALTPVIPPLVSAIGQVAQVLAGAFLSVLQAIAPVLPVIVTVIGQVAGMLAGALASALGAIIPILPPLAEAFAQIAVVLVGALMGALQAVIPILPTLIDVFLTLIQAAIIPLLPLLPMLATLIASILTAVAPLIPPLLQLVMVIIQLAVAALVPLLPFLPVVIGLFVRLVGALMPIIGVLLKIIGGFISFASVVASVVIGFVSTVLGIWTRLYTGISGIVTKIIGGVTGGFRGLVAGIKGIFSGIADFVGSMFTGIGGAVKGAINGVISSINGTVISGLNVVIDGINLVNPLDDVPHVPSIPRMHTGGEFMSGLPAGEGYAFLRDRETVVTPEDRDRAAALLVAASGGQLRTPAGDGAASAGGGPANVQIAVHASPGMSVGELSAHVAQDFAWALSTGATSSTPSFAGVAP